MSKSEYGPHHIPVVDNGSTDISANAIEDWGRSTGLDVHVIDQIAEKNEQNPKRESFGTNQLFILKLMENRGYTGGNHRTGDSNHGIRNGSPDADRILLRRIDGVTETGFA